MPEELEAIPELAPGVSELFDAYKAETARGSEVVEAALTNVTAKVAAGATAGAAGTTAGAVSVGAKVVLATVVLGAGAWLAFGGASPPPEAVAVAQEVSPAEEKSSPDEQPPPPVGAVESPPALAVPAPPPAAESPDLEVGPKKNRRVARKGTDSAQPSTLAAELRLLKEARTALRNGQGASALASVRAHRKTYPSSELAEERDATEVMALCVVGNSAKARKKAADFSRRFPGSKRDILASCSDESKPAPVEANEG